MLTIYAPDQRLANFIDCFWTLPHSIGSVLQTQEIMTPGISVELIFNQEAVPKICLIRGSSFMSRNPPILPSQTDPNPIFGVRFKLNGLHPFSLFSLNDFEIAKLSRSQNQHAHVDPADILGKGLTDLAEMLFIAPSVPEKLALANRFFIDRLAKIRPVDYFTGHLIQELFKEKGMGRIDLLSRKYRVHKKTVERRFADVTGLTPKTLNRIIRFNHVLQIFNGRDKQQISEFADRMGYYDLSHFRKDFRNFTGISPAAFFAAGYHTLDWTI